MGERLAAGLATSGRVRRLVLAGRSSAALAVVAATVASVSDCLIEPVRADATCQDAVAELLAGTRPDLVVQCAALRSPWALASRQDPAARAVAAAGLGLRLPYQLPVILSVMRAARDAGYAGPVANLSFPDVTGPILRRLRLAPALGLGNAGMILRRVRAALHAAEPEADLPLMERAGASTWVRTGSGATNSPSGRPRWRPGSAITPSRPRPPSRYSKRCFPDQRPCAGRLRLPADCPVDIR